jgi:hypothetical protein
MMEKKKAVFLDRDGTEAGSRPEERPRFEVDEWCPDYNAFVILQSVDLSLERNGEGSSL